MIMTARILHESEYNTHSHQKIRIHAKLSPSRLFSRRLLPPLAQALLVQVDGTAPEENHDGLHARAILTSLRHLRHNR